MADIIETDLVKRIQRLVDAGKVSKTTIGKDAVNDPGLVFTLERGRELRSPTRSRITEYLDRLEGAAQ